MNKLGRSRALAPSDDLDYQRKCAHAFRLRLLYNLPWHEISVSLWPLNDYGEPTPDAVPMFEDSNICRRNVTQYREKQIVKYRDDVIKDVYSHVAFRQAALAQAVGIGDCAAIEQHRKEDELLLKMVGGYAPVKIAPTDVAGNDRPGILVIPASIDTSAWTASAVTYQENVRKLSIDHRRDED